MSLLYCCSVYIRLLFRSTVRLPFGHGAYRIQPSKFTFFDERIWRCLGEKLLQVQKVQSWYQLEASRRRSVHDHRLQYQSEWVWQLSWPWEQGWRRLQVRSRRHWNRLVDGSALWTVISSVLVEWTLMLSLGVRREFGGVRQPPLLLELVSSAMLFFYRTPDPLAGMLLGWTLRSYIACFTDRVSWREALSLFQS